MTSASTPKGSTGISAESSKDRIIRILRLNSTLIAFIVLWVALSFATPYFLTVDNILNILLQASNIGIMAVGMTLVVIAAEIDLSVGAVEALAGSVAAVLLVNLGMPTVIAFVGAIGVGILAGFIIGFFTSRFGIPSFITSLGMMSIARGFALLMTNGKAVYGLSEPFNDVILP